MFKPLRTYLDPVATSAHEKAESGTSVDPRGDWPSAPLIAPWVGAVPLLALLSDGTVATTIFIVALIVSLGGFFWSGMAYQQLVEKCRDQLGRAEQP